MLVRIIQRDRTIKYRLAGKSVIVRIIQKQNHKVESCRKGHRLVFDKTQVMWYHHCQPEDQGGKGCKSEVKAGDNHWSSSRRWARVKGACSSLLCLLDFNGSALRDCSWEGGSRHLMTDSKPGSTKPSLMIKLLMRATYVTMAGSVAAMSFRPHSSMHEVAPLKLP